MDDILIPLFSPLEASGPPMVGSPTMVVSPTPLPFSPFHLLFAGVGASLIRDTLASATLWFSLKLILSFHCSTSSGGHSMKSWGLFCIQSMAARMPFPAFWPPIHSPLFSTMLFSCPRPLHSQEHCGHPPLQCLAQLISCPYFIVSNCFA